MEWIIRSALVMGIIVAILGLFLGNKKGHKKRSVPGFFSFDQYKERELSQRGVFDKMKW
ncbi:hypothetical protein DMR_09510 [Solidesulfovibrio magneticus RS-1]|uniref:Uncharacterized protein n=1 Tax=Solidesulfovibrio magneticus (strain ATCC 700980 / DSM 13731 / RS-1) TaxID=573370 RepID=C4XKQ1_SOLM1|nr:hypothetical protein DMR_09510 [Solidesulfovibrio magneticus RS-1]